MKRWLSIFAILWLVLGNLPIFAQAQEAVCSGQKECEALLAQIESQIEQNEATIDQYKRQGSSLKNEISSLNAKINKLNLQIKAVNLTLQKLDSDIFQTQGEIQVAENKLDTNKGALTNLLRQLYESEKMGLVEVLLRHPSISDFAGNIGNLITIQESLSTRVTEIANLRTQLVDKKEILSVKREDAAALKAAQDAQKAVANRVKKDKANLLAETKGQESKYQAILKQTQKTAAQIRSRLFELLGGGELTFDAAYKFAKFAQDATGVRAAFILAILDRESALGQNVGKCNYKTAMNPTRDIPLFLTLTSALSINPDTITVSCANRDGVYGGAMGPAQFIPSTWNLYQPKVSEYTGHNPPSPWNNGDAFIATALYLKDLGADRDQSKERRAAAIYYCGGNWTRYACTVYARRVLETSQQFQNDIDVLNS